MDISFQASSLLSLLENYNFSRIYSEFLNFLRPFSPLISSNNLPTKPSQPLGRSLAKTYLSFINRFITLIPQCLSESPKNPNTIEFEEELLKCYNLCLDCLKAIAPELSGKPYCLQLQRARYVHCLMRGKSYVKAIEEGFKILEELGVVNFNSCGMEVMIGHFAPRIAGDRGNSNGNEGGVDGDFAHLIVDLVVLISQCVWLSKLKDASAYTKLLTLLKEVRPWLSWFRNMEDSSSSKLQWRLLAYLKNIALFLVKETTDFEGNIVSNFCAAVFDEYTRLLNAQSHQATEKGVLEEFLSFLSNFTYKCQFAGKLVRDAVAMHLYNSAGDLSEVPVCIRVIQKLYALGLYFTEFGFEPNNYFSSKGSGGITSVSFSVDVWKKLQDLSALLRVSDKPSHKHRDFVQKASLHTRCYSEALESCKLTNGEEYISSYLKALKFLCCPLAVFMSTERKRIIMEDMESPIGDALKIISESFLQYCHLFLCCHQHQDTCGKIDMTVLSISLCAFTFSLKLKLSFEKNSGLLVLSDKCILSLRPQLLKYVVTILHNIFVEFCRHERLKEASEALELCCKVSWSRCLLFCEIRVGKQKGSDGESSENMIAESVNEACKISCHLMDILHQTDGCIVEKVCGYGLEIWCSSKNLWEQLPCPVALIRHWVKLQCKYYRNVEGDASILGSYLFQSLGVATNNIFLEIVGTIFEQELVVYEEMSNIYPRFCRKMQMEIIEFLLHKVYLSTNYMQRSLILIKKGMLSRSSGAGGLDSCIHCLSEAIGLISGSSGVTLDKVNNQLAIMYCLRALSTHEAKSTSKEIFEDVCKAVNIWKRIDIPCSSSLDRCDLGCDYVLLLLYHIADLLSIKGDTTLHSDVLSVIIKVLKQMNITLDKCLLVLWESRRVNHALCVVPTNEAFIMALSEHYGKDAESIDFWISSFKDSKPLSVGLQQNFSFLSSLFPLAFNQHKHCLQSELSIDEVKAVALSLISNDPVSRCSTYIAGYLYHDLSERLCAGGRIIEGLFCAKEAYWLRRKLLLEHFSYSIQHLEEDHGEFGKTMRKPSACVSQFSVLHQAAIRAWPAIGISHGLDEVVLTSWNVLRCYLESTLQVGVINEKLGNVAEAEAQFRLGKNIACLQNLPQFIVSFSICLGKVYLGMNLFDAAKLELATSEQVLAVMRNSLTCSRCALVLESSINDQLGNMYRKGIFSASENPYELSLRNFISLEKGDISAWLEGARAEHCMLVNRVHTDSEFGNRTGHECDAGISRLENISQSVNMKVKTETKRSRKVKKDLESQTLNFCAAEQKLTRSRRLPSRGSRTDGIKLVGNASNSNLNGKLKSETPVITNQVTCQKCFSSKHNLKGSFTYFIQMKWEFIRRRQILKLLNGLGKCKESSSDTQRSRTIYYKCLTILLGGNDCYCTNSTLPELDSVGLEIPGDILVGERAEVLYNLSWILLTAFYSKDIRTSGTCSDLNGFQMSHVITFLTISFVLSREIPLLFQKVSRLLALIYVVLASSKNLPSISSCNVLSENHWAAYFHQASVGTYYNLQLLSAFTIKHRSHAEFKVKGHETAVETSVIAESCTLLRMVPESTEDIKKYVQKFFQNLPSTTIVCASLLGDSYSSLLGDLSCNLSGQNGWLLLSHLNADSEPAVVLLPVCTISQEEETSSSCSIFGENSVQEEWCAPWGCNAVVDDVAPLFKMILRGNYLSCSSFHEDHTERSREIWWTWRENLNKRLHKLLQDVEETWFGQYKYLLLGRWLDAEPLDKVVKEFMHKLNKDGHKETLNESILKIVMGDIKSMKKKVKIPKVFLEKGCYIGNTIHCYQGTCDTPDEEDDGFKDVSNSLIAAVNKVELEYCTRREPVVLVLDNDVQMLPLENMPLMREQEVYRMPSVASILFALQRRSVVEEAAKLGTKFPLIDPLDAFYLLNPSGDLSRTQAEFEEWFRDRNMQGKAGVIPSIEELSAALEKHDLFLYFGHGSGAQYMPRDEIQKLERCSALLLMGCSSGSLNLKGRYAPVGTSLSYMMAGAPIVVANLWEVTDLDIDRFAKAVLKSFLEERSMFSKGCIQCSLLAEELKSMTVNETKGNTKKGRGKKKAVDPVSDDLGAYCFRHKLRAGYFVSQARKACKLPYLIGAAPVCYGVPTGIWKKKDC